MVKEEEKKSGSGTAGRPHVHLPVSLMNIPPSRPVDVRVRDGTSDVRVGRLDDLLLKLRQPRMIPGQSAGGEKQKIHDTSSGGRPERGLSEMKRWVGVKIPQVTAPLMLAQHCNHATNSPSQSPNRSTDVCTRQLKLMHRDGRQLQRLKLFPQTPIGSQTLCGSPNTAQPRTSHMRSDANCVGKRSAPPPFQLRMCCRNLLTFLAFERTHVAKCHLVNLEVTHTQITNLPLILQLGHGLPRVPRHFKWSWRRRTSAFQKRNKPDLKGRLAVHRMNHQEPQRILSGLQSQV